MIEFLPPAHIVTADDPFGVSWPPDGSCSIARRSTSGFTLSETRTYATPPACARFISRRQRGHDETSENAKSGNGERRNENEN